MRTCRLLMRLPRGRLDLLQLRAPDGGDYPRGVPGLGDGFFAVGRAVADVARGYAGAAALGTSLGGYTALRAAVLTGLRAGVSLSGRFTALSTNGGERGAMAYDPLCGCTRAARTALIAYYARRHAVDAAHARRLAAMHPPVQLRGVDGRGDHNVMVAMLPSGAFDGLLEEVLRLCREGGAAD
jgi:hypothetical protein